MFTFEHDILLYTKTPLNILTSEYGYLFNLVEDCSLYGIVISKDGKKIELQIKADNSSYKKSQLLSHYPNLNYKVVDCNDSDCIIVRISKEIIESFDIGDLVAFDNLYIGMLKTNDTGLMFFVSTSVSKKVSEKELIKEDVYELIQNDILMLKSLTEKQRYMFIYGLTWISNTYLESLRRGLFEVSTDIYKTINAVDRLTNFILEGDWNAIQSLQETLSRKGMDFNKLYTTVQSTPNFVKDQLSIETIKEITMKLQMEKKFMDIDDDKIFYRIADEFNPPIRRHGTIWKIEKSDIENSFKITKELLNRTYTIMLDSLERYYVDSKIDELYSKNIT